MMLVNDKPTLPWWLVAQIDRFVVLGRTCTDHGCWQVARWAVAWPGARAADNVKCTAHRDGWKQIADVFAMELHSWPLEVRTTLDDSAQRFAMMELV